MKAEIKKLQKELYGKKKTETKEEEEKEKDENKKPEAVQEFLKEKEKFVLFCHDKFCFFRWFLIRMVNLCIVN